MQSNKWTNNLLKMKVFSQETDFTCGGSIIKTLLNYYGILGDKTEHEISIGLNTGTKQPNLGTHPDDMVEYLRSEGLQVISSENGTIELLRHCINQGVPVIVLDSKWGGHWRMVIGYNFHSNLNNEEEDYLFFADPAYKDIESNIDCMPGTVTETSRNFYDEWYECMLFEKRRNRFYIAAYPKTKIFIQYNKRKYSK